MNEDSIYQILDRCDIQSLLYGLGTTNKQFQKYAKSVLARQTSLTIGGKMRLRKRMFFNLGNQRNRIRIAHDVWNKNVFLNRGIFNVGATDAAKKFQQIFPNVTEICICDYDSGDYSMIKAFILCFPELKSLKSACHYFYDLSQILQNLPKLEHFTDFGHYESWNHYHSSCPEVLERLDSYCFSIMDVSQKNIIIFPKKSVQFLYLQRIPDQFQQEMAKKLTCVGIPHFCTKINYEQFTNLESVLLALREIDANFFLRMLDMFSNMKKLKTLYLESFPILSEEFLKFLYENPFPVTKTITKVIIEYKISKQDENILKKIFPKATIFYPESRFF